MSVRYVVAIHDGVPYVIRMVAQASGIRAPDLLAGFSFAADESPAEPAEIEQPESIDGFRTFVAPDGSFEVRLPDTWTRRIGPDGHALYVSDRRTLVSFRFGDADGRIRQCDRPEILGEACGMIQAASHEELADALALSNGNGPEVHQGPLSSLTTLGGEPASTVSMIAGTSPPWGVTYVVAFHEGNPFIVRATQLRPPRAIDLDDVLAEFSFVGVGGLVWYSNPADGYEVLLPAIWADDPRTIDNGDQEATAFGYGRGFGTHGSPALAITIGEPDGTVTLCQTACRSAQVTSLTALEALARSVPSVSEPPLTETHADLILGGEPARLERPGRSGSCLGCPGALYQVFTIHDGRPVVLAFDYWTVLFQSMSALPDDLPFTDELDRIIESFTFTRPTEP